MNKKRLKELKKEPQLINNLSFGGGRNQVVTKRNLTIVNALNFDIKEGFFNRTFTAIKLIVRYIINN